ncbi:CPBP family intramembrane glutamic endopeptidase [Pseudomonas sp. Hp2]|uniref:CPBP family intramembrane glutamic endopeptidase n=1 Tax=Pseudomonas sp. Hp2 TaxID=701189 RepID=UPI0011261F93|nr:CPBP family intramembrane glutamic endopeptidase [Pseudomonas sp. Hp2]
MTEPQAPSSTVTVPALPPRAGTPVLGFFIDLLIGLGVLLVVSVAASVVWGVFRGFELAMASHRQGIAPAPERIAEGIGQPGAMAQMLIALASTASAALLLYFWRRRASAQERQASRAAIARRSTWGLVVAVAIGVFAFSALVGSVAEFLGIHPVPTNLALMEQAIDQYPWFLVVFAVALAPAYEELLFRRVLFGRLLAAGRPWLGMLLSSLAFALLHEVPGISGNGPWAILQLWLVYGTMGAAFAWLYWRTGTLWAPIVAHGLNNAVALAALHWFGIP